jgi:hypothetical protein
VKTGGDSEKARVSIPPSPPNQSAFFSTPSGFPLFLCDQFETSPLGWRSCAAGTIRVAPPHFPAQYRDLTRIKDRAEIIDRARRKAIEVPPLRCLKACKMLTRLTLPAQPVDATLSNSLIQQHFPREPICRAVLNQNLARAVFRLIQHL